MSSPLLGSFSVGFSLPPLSGPCNGMSVKTEQDFVNKTLLPEGSPVHVHYFIGQLESAIPASYGSY